MRLSSIKKIFLLIVCLFVLRLADSASFVMTDDEGRRTDAASLMEKIGFKLPSCDNESVRRWGLIRCVPIVVDGESYIAMSHNRKPYVYELTKLLSSEYVGSIYAWQFSSVEKAALEEFSSQRFVSSAFPDPIPSCVILEYRENGSIWIRLKGGRWCDLLHGNSVVGFHSETKDIEFCKKVVCGFLEVLEKDYDETKDSSRLAVEQILACLRLENIGKKSTEQLLDVLKEEAVADQEELWARKATIGSQWDDFLLWLRLARKHESRYMTGMFIEGIEAELISERLLEWKKLGRYTDADIEEIRKILEPELGIKIELGISRGRPH